MKVSQIPLMPVGGKLSKIHKIFLQFHSKKKNEVKKKKDFPNLMQLETLKPTEKPTQDKAAWLKLKLRSEKLIFLYGYKLINNMRCVN